MGSLRRSYTPNKLIRSANAVGNQLGDECYALSGIPLYLPGWLLRSFDDFTYFLQWLSLPVSQFCRTMGFFLRSIILVFIYITYPSRGNYV